MGGLKELFSQDFPLFRIEGSILWAGRVTVAGGEGRGASQGMWVWPRACRSGRRLQGEGESGQTSLLLGSGSGALALPLDGHFSLGSCTPAGSGQSLQPKEWLLTVTLSCDSPSSFAPIDLQGSVSSLVSPCLGGFCSPLGPWWVEGTPEERKGPSRAEMM